MSDETIHLGAAIDPFAATIEATRTVVGWQARFDISGVPRVDSMLVHRPAHTVPAVVSRLCGLCPVTHHLAGMRALDMLSAQPNEYAQRLRLLLHYGSVIDALALSCSPDRKEVMACKRLGQAIMALAGAQGHFPAVAIPGGVQTTCQLSMIPAVEEQIEQFRKFGTFDQGSVSDSFASRDLAVQDLGSYQALLEEPFGVGISLHAAGQWNPLGDTVQVVGEAGVTEFPVSELATRVREQRVGHIAPRPQVLVDNTWHAYRVGPSAQSNHYRVHNMRSSMVVAAVEAVSGLLEYFKVADIEPQIQDHPLHDGEGIGAVEGPRGLLIHRYTVVDGQLEHCQILSPTAQNEPWLADSLTRILHHAQQQGELTIEQTTVVPGLQARLALESAVRLADPCLPCALAPQGKMNLQIVLREQD